ncbi:MAG: hypothetical protein SFY81_08105 [Verrucomicrobiota bacterium]|nr:hypothetical protein [Verrucomicrobiota bacterium]
MLQGFRNLVAALLVFGASLTAHGFALLGPFEAWQTPALGYNPNNTDIGGPKNLGEEYRWNLPVIYYGFDEAFVDYFGVQGVAEIEKAIAQFNRMTNLAALDVSNFPVRTKRVNFTAEALGLIDLKSMAMGALTEEFGLASAERYVFTLRNQITDPAPSTNYFVIQRNFDPFGNPEPTNYVNDVRYTYGLFFFTAPDFTDAIEFPVDANAISFTAVSSTVDGLFAANLGTGEFFSALTRDDVAGLKYIYQRNNINREDVYPGTLIASTNFGNPLFITNIDLALFSSQTLTSSPTALLALYSNLTIISSNVFISNIVSTNIVVTNIAQGELFTNFSNLQIISNLDLFLFSQQSLTSSPAQLRALYPTLLIASTNTRPGLLVSVDSIVLTNLPPDPWGPPNQTNFGFVTNYVTNIITLYSYTYANLVTNYVSPTTFLEILTTNLIAEPWGPPPPFTIFRTNITSTFIPTNFPSGGFYIFDRTQNPNLVGYSFTDQFGNPLLTLQNLVRTTNFLFFTTNSITGDLVRQDLVLTFTNTVYAAYPIEIANANSSFVVTNLTTNFVVQFGYQFGNVTTNFPPGGPNPDVILRTIEFSLLGAPIVTTQIISSPFPLGTITINDPNLFVTTNCFSTIVFLTNVISDLTNVITGQGVRREIIYPFESEFCQAFPINFQAGSLLALRPGIDSIRLRRFNTNDILNENFITITNDYTVSILTNGTFVPQRFRRVSTGPDILFSARDLGTFTDIAQPVSISRTDTSGWINNGAQGQGGQAAGPGIITPQVTITFNKVGPGYFNIFPGFITEADAQRTFTWGSFDGSSRPPIVYPQDLSLQDLANRVFTNTVANP